MDIQEILLKRISTTIIDKRKEHNLTQKELADELGISNATLSYYERGERTPDIYTLVKISKLFDISLDELCGNETERKPKNSTPTVGDLARLIVELDKHCGIEPVFKVDCNDACGTPPFYGVNKRSAIADLHDYINSDSSLLEPGTFLSEEKRQLKIKAGFLVKQSLPGGIALERFIASYFNARDVKSRIDDMDGYADEVYNTLIEKAIRKADETDINELPF